MTIMPTIVRAVCCDLRAFEDQVADAGLRGDHLGEHQPAEREARADAQPVMIPGSALGRITRRSTCSATGAERAHGVDEHLRRGAHAEQRVVEDREEDDVDQREEDRLRAVAEPHDEDRNPRHLDDREQELEQRRQRERRPSG